MPQQISKLTPHADKQQNPSAEQRSTPHVSKQQNPTTDQLPIDATCLQATQPNSRSLAPQISKQHNPTADLDQSASGTTCEPATKPNSRSADRHHSQQATKPNSRAAQSTTPKRGLTWRQAPYTCTSRSLLNLLLSSTSRTRALYCSLSCPMLGDSRFTATSLPRHLAAYTQPKPPAPCTCTSHRAW